VQDAQASPVSSLQLVFQDFAVVTVAEKEITVEPLEITVDVLERGNGFDAVDCGSVTFSGDSCAFHAMQLLDLGEVIVECSRDVSSRSSCFSAANRAVVDHHDRPSGTGEEVRGSHARDAGAYDADAGSDVVGEGGKIGHIGIHPDRCSVTGIASHRCWLRVFWVEQSRVSGAMAQWVCHVIL